MTTRTVQVGAPAVTAPSAQTGNRRLLIIVSLAIVYIVWGTTYLVIRFALESFTPYWLMGIRFVIAGSVLFAFLRLQPAAKRPPMPTGRQWLSASIIGLLLLGFGMGSVAWAEETVSSGLAAALVATSPLWTMLFGLIWRQKPTRYEWIGVGLGLIGAVLLGMEGNLQANPGGIALILFATAAWAFGSLLMKRLDMPRGAMGNAAEMLMGGLILCGMAILRGEPFPVSVTPGAALSITYLITFGSLGTMSAYFYLLHTVSPALATSYSFVNPAVALLIGVVIGGEVLTGSALVALPIILLGLTFVFRRKPAAAD